MNTKTLALFSALGATVSSFANVVNDPQFSTLGNAGSVWTATGGPWYPDANLYDGLGNSLAPSSASTSANYYFPGVLTQTLSGVTIGQTYHLDLDIYSQDTAADLLQPQNLAPGGLINGLSIDLGAGVGSSLVQNNTLGYLHLSGTLKASSNTLAIMGWDTNYMQISNAQLTPVPEPASVAVFAIGGLGLLSRRNRKR